VAKCTVERPKRVWGRPKRGDGGGQEGVRRTKRVRTTVSDPAAARPADLVDRDFTIAASNELFVADFTYVRLACGRFADSAFVIDAFAGGTPTLTHPPAPRPTTTVRNATTIPWQHSNNRVRAKPGSLHCHL
jgi:transposase InsO family protein